MTVEELLNKEKINFKLKGNDYQIRCLHPDHEDSNPSLNIDMHTGIMHCFSCGFKGNIFNYFGVPTIYRPDRVRELKTKIQKYLDGENIIPENATPFARDFRNIKAETYRKFNAFTSDQDIQFRDRIVFPITNIYGKVIKFVGRSMHSDAQRTKYLITPKGVTLVPFPSVPKIIDNSIILVEGIFDMLNLHDKGLENAVSCFGLNRKAEFFVPYKLQGVHKVYILFDNDKAGKKGSLDTKRELSHLFHIIIWKLKEHQTDPGSLSLNEVEQLKTDIYERSDY